MPDRVISRVPSDLRRSAPATRAKAIEISSSDDDVDVPLGATLYVGEAGDLTVTAAFSSTPVLLKEVQGFIPISVKTVHGNGTTAGSIVALW